MIYFQSNAEIGDLSEWVADGGGGVYTADGVDPSSLSTLEVQASTEQAHAGTHSIRCYLANPATVNNAKLMRWWDGARKHFPKTAYYEAWYNFDPGYFTVTWDNIMQWKTVTDKEPTFVVRALTINGVRQMSLSHWPVGQGFLPPQPGQPVDGKYYQANPISLLSSTWVKLRVYYKLSRTQGVFILWQDGAQLFKLEKINTQDSIQKSPPNTAVMFGVGAYMSPTERPGQLLYVDDIKVEV